MPLSPDEREWIRQQALKQAQELDAKKRMAKVHVSLDGSTWLIPAMDTLGADTRTRLSDLVDANDRQFLAQLKIQADF